MRIKIVFNQPSPFGGYESFDKYMARVNEELEKLESQGFIIVDVDVKEFKNGEDYTQIKYKQANK